MHIIVCEDPGTSADTRSFAARARSVLRAHRVGTSLIATWLSGWLSGKQLAPTKWFLLVEGDRVVAVAMHAEGLNVVISPMDTENRVAAVTKLTEMLMVIGDPVPGVSAKEADAEAFSQVWGSQFEVSPRVTMNDVIYEIHGPPAGPTVEGTGRTAGPDDSPVLGRWLTEFNVEALPRVAGHDPATDGAKRLAWGGFHVWQCDQTLVSMAGLNGPAEGMARIGPVYTPTEFRRHGFGAAVTAYATRAAFDQGADLVMLFADRDNPGSNRVYAGLGFQPVGTSVMIAFDPADAR